MINRILLSILIVLLFISTSFAATQDRLPTGNGTTSNWNYGGSGGGCVSEATKWECVNDTIGTPDDANYIHILNVNNTQMFTASAFDINSTAISNVKVTARCKEIGGDVTLNFRLRVNGVETYVGGAVELTTSFVDYDSGTTWNNNPAGGSWTEVEVEGGGTNPLQQFGVYPTNIITSEEVQCSQVYITVTYTPVASTQNKLLSFPVEDWE